MRLRFWNLFLKLQYMATAEDGQDLVEYVLIAGLIATACVASTNAFARLLLTTYTSIATTFDGYV
jgi:Flp pilus assembly pilin Flp